MHCQPDLLQTVSARGSTSCLASLLHCRQKKCNQHCDDRDDHQKLNQRKAFRAMSMFSFQFHSNPLKKVTENGQLTQENHEFQKYGRTNRKISSEHDGERLFLDMNIYSQKQPKSCQTRKISGRFFDAASKVAEFVGGVNQAINVPFDWRPKT